MTRNELFEHIKSQYSAAPEYLWFKDPDSCVFRRADNQKWYGVVMKVSREKVGLDGRESTDILVLKGEPDNIVHIAEAKGFAPAYHMNKKHWFTVILEETADSELVSKLIAKSYKLAGGRPHLRKE